MRLLPLSFLARSLSSCALALAAAGGLHAAPLEVTTLTPLTQTAPTSKTPPIRRFPFVSGLDAHVTARINNLLFIETFEVPAPVHTSYGLREVSEEVWQHQPEIDFQVQRNDARIFSVMLSTEGCGAYCENYTTPYAFDAANGRRLGSEDIFTLAGRTALSKQLKAANLTAIQTEIHRLQDEETSARQRKQPPSEDRTAALKMYAECAQFRQSPEYGTAQGKLQIQTQALVLSMERCSNHALRALDSLGDFSLRFSPEQLKPWLSAYGRTLLLGETPATAAPTTPWGQVLHGKISANMPVTLHLGPLSPDGTLSGSYFYDRYRKPIALSGRFETGTLTLTEADSKETPPPRLVLTPQGEGLRGHWEGASTLDIVLEP
jgi:hypothetical protein